MDVHHRMNKL